jgi:hypothetical protein
MLKFISTHGWVFLRRTDLSEIQFGKISANLDDIRPKSVADIQLCAFDHF